MDRTKVKTFLPLLITMLLLALVLPAHAEGDDVGLWTSIGAEKKLSKQWSIGIEGEFRTRNDLKTADRWDIGVDGEYKVAKWLRASAGYTLLYDNNKEKITYNNDGSYNNWRPSYWGVRHRFNISLTGRIDAGRWTFSLRERWQYTYRPSKTTERYDFDNSWWEDKTVKGKGKSVLRSRLKVDYNIPKCKVDPHAEVELFNSWGLQKTRVTVGGDWKVAKQHTISFAYAYQNVGDDDDDNDPNSHIIAVGYKYKF